ncbi:MAG: cytochrome c [Glaciimonas sp.]|nr:cytochrome c [Glaciimonas sp.]
MQFIKHSAFGLLLVAVINIGYAQTAPLTIALPSETAKLKESTHPGYVIAMSKCAMCHSVDYIDQQPHKMTLAQWTGEVKKMKDAYGAPLTDDDIKQVSEYLAVTYNSSN